jgi:NAD(P)-dependent dehydrogenase (short-subunit alcohol dehydrogenase family)
MTMRQNFPLALITGGSSRLGRDFAMALGRMGYAIALHYHEAAEKAQAIAGEIHAIGVPINIFQCDLSDTNQIESLFSFVDSLGFSLKVLVNSAAIMTRGDLHEFAPNEFDSTMDLNLRAPLLCAQYAVVRMQPCSSIINISDVGAHKNWTGYPMYVISKAGLETLTRLLARTYAPGIRVNAIAPGLVYESEGLQPGEWIKLVSKIPLQRAARPEEVVAALEFLLKNEYVTGQTIVVDGGYSLL